jgi:hypothetical protein
VLALHGEHDWIVADDDHTRIVAWVTAAGGVAEASTLPGIDHDLCRHPSRAVSFRERGRGSPDVLAAALTLAWMRARVARADRASAFTGEPPAGHTAAEGAS